MTLDDASTSALKASASTAMEPVSALTTNLIAVTIKLRSMMPISTRPIER